jgi:hypothetical protein
MQVTPRRLNQTIAGLFAVGSACFVLGSLPSYADAVGASANAVTYFIGSLFFTTASGAQLVQSQTPGATDVDPATQRVRTRLTWFDSRTDNLFWWAAVVQFPGTLFFNVTTLVATADALTPHQTQAHVWRPDFLGSVLFLVSSMIAAAAVRRDHMPHRFRSWGWWIAGVNLLGSVAFMVSALAARLVGGTTQMVNADLADAGTLVGAIGFLVGAMLMLPAWESSLHQEVAA